MKDKKSPIRILIVDDEEDMRELLKIFLSGDSYIVEEACSGLVGLKMIKTSAFDLIITDVLMPEMDGIAMMEAVNDLGLDSKFIVISGGEMNVNPYTYFHQAISLGACATIRKPFVKDDLILTINGILPQEKV